MVRKRPASVIVEEITSLLFLSSTRHPDLSNMQMRFSLTSLPTEISQIVAWETYRTSCRVNVNPLLVCIFMSPVPIAMILDPLIPLIGLGSIGVIHSKSPL